MFNREKKIIKAKSCKSRSGFGLLATPPHCTGQTLEVTSSTSPPLLESTTAAVPSFGHQTYTFSNAYETKSTNRFGSSITSSSENRFGLPSVFSFGSKNTFPGNMQPDNSSGQTVPSVFKLTTDTSNSFAATTNSKQRSSVGNGKAHNPFDFSNFDIFHNCEPPKFFPEEIPKFTDKELQKSPKATSPENSSPRSEALEKLTDTVNSLSFRLDQLELVSYQNSSPRKERSDLLPWNLYKPKLQLNEKRVPDDLEVQRLAGVLNCVILTVPEKDRKEIEFFMLLVSAWPCLPGYLKTVAYSKMETLWQTLSDSIRSDESLQFRSPLSNESHSLIGSPKGFPSKTESP